MKPAIPSSEPPIPLYLSFFLFGSHLRRPNYSSRRPLSSQQRLSHQLQICELSRFHASPMLPKPLFFCLPQTFNFATPFSSDHPSASTSISPLPQTEHCATVCDITTRPHIHLISGESETRVWFDGITSTQSGHITRTVCQHQRNSRHATEVRGRRGGRLGGEGWARELQKTVCTLHFIHQPTSDSSAPSTVLRMDISNSFWSIAAGRHASSPRHTLEVDAQDGCASRNVEKLNNCGVPGAA
ncbi:hypothetical protein BLNAU_16811 [Blattamonas nauphoetae]|uniref:Uncharacterized protein n=1 Tax=Blattamonas nauphoetae TaxID=2049346 RepID=A0ABQ9XAC6_9EUKA|nr:hypothetical protein BLNAU_16811 [Blattamonas nauphoetae]